MFKRFYTILWLYLNRWGKWTTFGKRKGMISSPFHYITQSIKQCKGQANQSCFMPFLNGWLHSKKEHWITVYQYMLRSIYINKKTAQWNMRLVLNSNSSLCAHLWKVLLWAPTIQEDKQKIKDLSACVSVIDEVLACACCLFSLSSLFNWSVGSAETRHATPLRAQLLCSSGKAAASFSLKCVLCFLKELERSRSSLWCT